MLHMSLKALHVTYWKPKHNHTCKAHDKLRSYPPLFGAAIADLATAIAIEDEVPDLLPAFSDKDVQAEDAKLLEELLLVPLGDM